MQEYCTECVFGADHIANERLSCNGEEIVVFTANIYSQYPENVLQYIEQWLSSGNATIIINNDWFIMDHDCNPQIKLGFDAQFCTSVSEPVSESVSATVSASVSATVSASVSATASINTSQYVLYGSIGGGTGLIVIIIVIILIAVLMALLYKRKGSMGSMKRYERLSSQAIVKHSSLTDSSMKTMILN